MIQSDFIKKFENYLDEHYDLETYEVFGENEEHSKILEKLNFYFKRFFGAFKNYFGFYLESVDKVTKEVKFFSGD